MEHVKQRIHKPSAQTQDKWSYKIKEAFLRFFGDIKLFQRQPRLFFLPDLLSTVLFGSTLVYDPRSYLVKGTDMRRAMNDIQPGDILVRGFENYVDGNFIPGFFSHAGLYLGKVDETTIRQYWSTHLAGSAPNEGDYAKLAEVLEKAVHGEQMVIHSMKDGIFMEDLLNFCRCDYMVALRFPASVTRSADVQRPYSENAKIKKVFTVEERQIAERLEKNSAMPFAEIFPVIFKLALSQLGTQYDFGLDFSSFKKMSCTEFVYYCTKSLEWCANVRPETESVMGIKSPGIVPDGFAGSAHLDLSFASDSVNTKNVIAEIRGRYPGPYGTSSK
jgi:hypothetical protein